MQDIRSYEAAVVLRADLSDEQIDAYITRLLGIITSQGGEPGEPDKWGRRRLAYEIERQRDGYYAILPFKSPPEAPEELRRVMRLSEEVIRFLVVHPPKPPKAQPARAPHPGAEAGAAPREMPSRGASAPYRGRPPEAPSAPVEPPASAGAAEAETKEAPPIAETPAPATPSLAGAEQREIPD